MKLKLLTSAFPESLTATHISRILSKFDADADKFIREHFNIAAFSEECREYDEHLKFHPVHRNRQRFVYLTMAGPNPASTQGPSTGPYTKLQTPPAANTANLASGPVQRKQISWPAQFERKADNRIKTVMDRMDLTTGRKTRSFQRQDGTVKFIERACELCEKMEIKD